ncbi:MAG TPA: MgtC/SapB family protein [Candidatus Limnocylindrales bacterium]|nr:MgtC/SapB family protein [Candidatus Limnocylindrales bacterium]
MLVPDELLFTARVVAAATAGALIGFEREIHSHPAGLRTHVMVALGSATFAILSMYGFGDVLGSDAVVLDPSRVAAQIVSGIGFIGGGAILKYGPSIRGLTTAGSLWATAAVGFAFGSGLVILGAGVTAVILFVLWPFNLLIDRLRSGREGRLTIRLALSRLESLSDVYASLRSARVQVIGIESRRIGKGHYEVDLGVVPPGGLKLTDLAAGLAEADGIEVIEVGTPESY